jgi:membrane-associated phospholipid phosphatase
LSAPAAARSRWSLAVELLNRPYPLTARVVVPAVTFMLLVPGYLVIGALTRGRTLHLPALALDHMIPLQPAWAPIYLSYLLFPFLPMLVIRQEELIRRTFLAWLMVWLVGYACFLVYPTTLPRPIGEIGEGFFAWFLRGIYDADAPRNCFPSLHVATPFVAALTCWRVHRGVGLAAVLWASLVALSTVFTKQHYVVDVIAGIFLAGVAHAIFLRNCPRVAIPELDRRAAPLLMLGLIGIYGLVVAGLWVAYLLR